MKEAISRKKYAHKEMRRNSSNENNKRYKSTKKQFQKQ